MSHSSKSHKQQVYEFLKKLNANETFDYNADEDIRRCVYTCVRKGYVSGYKNCDHTANGTIVFSPTRPRVEIDGFNFIDDYDKENALDVANKANATSISAKLKANKSFILSIIAVALTLLINADKIVSNVQKILSVLGMLG